MKTSKGVAISMSSMRQRFHSCTEDFVANVCHGRCCEGSRGLKVVVADSEVDRIRGMGVAVSGNFIEAAPNGKCPFKADTGLCKIHTNKPFGCSASPFILTVNDVLVVRNRYRFLKCFNCEGAIPVYQAHRWSLIKIFGRAEYDRLCKGIEEDVPGLTLYIARREYALLKENDRTRHPLTMGARNAPI